MFFIILFSTNKRWNQRSYWEIRMNTEQCSGESVERLRQCVFDCMFQIITFQAFLPALRLGNVSTKSIVICE